MNKSFSFFVCALLGSLLPSSTVWSQQTVDEQMYRHEVSVLSSDDFGGRKPLTPYETKTVNYLADKFKEYGLQPANGGSYFQEVPLLSVRTNIDGGRVKIKGRHGTVTLRQKDDLLVWSVRGDKKTVLKNEEIVFAGFGINAPEFGWNDYAHLDVKGKIVVVMVNDPGFYNDYLFHGKFMTYYGRWSYKFEEASRQGADGVLIIHDTDAASYNYEVLQASRGDVSLSLYSETQNKEFVAMQGWISQEGARSLFKASGFSLDEAMSRAKQPGFKGFSLGTRATFTLNKDVMFGNSRNVAAVLPGTTRSDECIVYTAHWDHLGFGTPVDGDSIYNGAEDNASAMAALLVLAKKFAALKERPSRSVLFLAVTAEEALLIGSDYYTHNPLFPLSKTMVDINLEMVGPRSKAYDVEVQGFGDTNTDRLVALTAAAQGRHLSVPAQDTRGWYFRSDHYSFAKMGVPVILLSSGSQFVNPNDAEKYSGPKKYHTVKDEYSPSWDVAGTLDDINLWFSLGWQIADSDFVPEWTGNTSFKAIREACLKQGK